VRTVAASPAATPGQCSGATIPARPHAAARQTAQPGPRWPRDLAAPGRGPEPPGACGRPGRACPRTGRCPAPAARREQRRPVLAGPARGVQHLPASWHAPRQPAGEIGMGGADGAPVPVVVRAVHGIEALHAQRPALSQERHAVTRRHVHNHSLHPRHAPGNRPRSRAAPRRRHVPAWCDSRASRGWQRARCLGMMNSTALPSAPSVCATDDKGGGSAGTSDPSGSLAG
jgi:hypothetical protein